jgi:hypothetical protein
VSGAAVTKSTAASRRTLIQDFRTLAKTIADVVGGAREAPIHFFVWSRGEMPCKGSAGLFFRRRRGDRLVFLQALTGKCRLGTGRVPADESAGKVPRASLECI